MQRTPLQIVTAFLTLTLALANTTHAQTKESVLHAFSGGRDGAYPNSLVMDSAGNFFGTAINGGSITNCPYGCGVVFKLSSDATGHWSLRVLHSFSGGSDGASPEGLIIDGSGNLYGLTNVGGTGTCSTGCGVAYKLALNSSGNWIYTALYHFKGTNDGAWPYGTLVMDGSGNLFGTAFAGGSNGGGTVFELSPTSTGSWNETTIDNLAFGIYPQAGVTFDSAGNLYGTTSAGGSTGNGTVFQLSPNGAGWTETIIHDFTASNGDGSYPTDKLWIDAAGNVYGTTFWGGTGSDPICVNHCGIIFQLSPVGGSWQETILHEFHNVPDGGNSYSGLVMDTAGNLFGSTISGGVFHGSGVTFKLSPTSGGGWTETRFHAFIDGNDGGGPGGVFLDSAGNVYGTAVYGGPWQYGVVFKLSSAPGR
jgi:uncharacterized repeat protein (TIGR03803 family)